MGKFLYGLAVVLGLSLTSSSALALSPVTVTFGITPDMNVESFESAELQITTDGTELWIVTPPRPVEPYDIYSVQFGAEGLCSLTAITSAGVLDNTGSQVRAEILRQSENLVREWGIPRTVDEVEFGYGYLSWGDAVRDGRRKFRYIWADFLGHNIFPSWITAVAISAERTMDGYLGPSLFVQFLDRPCG